MGDVNVEGAKCQRRREGPYSQELIGASYPPVYHGTGDQFSSEVN